MPRDYAAMTTLVTTKLQSAGTADFSVAEVDYQIEECLKEFAVYRPHLVPMLFKLESRTGTDVTGTASKLTDSVESQFLAADATEEKVVHNTTDNTWAVVLAQDSTSILSLSADIMDANEKYEIYNKRCRNQRQIYIGDIYDSPQIDSVEFPLGTRRNWKLYGDVLELNVETVPDSDSTLTTLNNVDVLVWFERPHILSQLTDWGGTIAATAAAAATAISGSSLQSAGTIEEGEEIHIENLRQLYVVTAAATIAANTAAIGIYPPLEAAVASTAWTFTFRKSSLAPQDEDAFADLVAARLAINKAPLAIRGVTAAITVLSSASSALSNMTAQIQAATTQTAAGTTEVTKGIALILTAATALAKIDGQVAAATASIASGTAYINTITVLGDVAGKYAQYAGVDLNAGLGYLREAEGYFQQARQDEVLGDTYGGLAGRSLANAAQYLNQSMGYMRRIATELSIANSWKHYQEWGERKLAQVLSRLKSQTPPKTKRSYPTA